MGRCRGSSAGRERWRSWRSRTVHAAHCPTPGPVRLASPNPPAGRPAAVISRTTYRPERAAVRRRWLARARFVTGVADDERATTDVVAFETEAVHFTSLVYKKYKLKWWCRWSLRTPQPINSSGRQPAGAPLGCHPMPRIHAHTVRPHTGPVSRIPTVVDRSS